MKFQDFTSRKKLVLDHDCMELAKQTADKGLASGNPPDGAVLRAGSIILSESDTTISEDDPTNHAVMNVVKKAIQTLNRQLYDATLYTIKEPCSMCILAAHYAGIKEVVFQEKDLEYGFVNSKLKLNESLLSYREGLFNEDANLQSNE